MHRPLTLAAMILAGCGQTHDLDAGYDAGPRVWDSCDELLVAEDGEPCEDVDYTCREPSGETCPREMARCVDGLVSRERLIEIPSWGGEEHDPADCAVGEADVVAGAARFDRGVIQELGGFTNSMTLMLTSGEPFYECPYPMLVVGFVPDMDLDYEGTRECSGRLLLPEGDVPVTGTVTIVRNDQETGIVEGTISLTGEAAAEGSFAVSACRELFVPSI